MSEKNIIEMYMDSLTEHAGLRRLEDFRNEDSKGQQQGVTLGEMLYLLLIMRIFVSIYVRH